MPDLSRARCRGSGTAMDMARGDLYGCQNSWRLERAAVSLLADDAGLVFRLVYLAQVGRVRLLGDEAGVKEFGQPLPQDAGGHVVAALLQRAEPDRPVLQLPEDAQVPAAAEQVEGGHQGSPGTRSAYRPAGPGCRHRLCHPS